MENTSQQYVDVSRSRTCRIRIILHFDIFYKNRKNFVHIISQVNYSNQDV